MRGGYVQTGWKLVARAVGAAMAIVAFGAPAEVCQLHPIALPASVVSSATPGTVLQDVYQGMQSGNFGWLTWAGSPAEPALVGSFTLPGNAHAYVNPDNAADRQLSVGDWVRGKPGVSNGKSVRDALDALKTVDITVPVWNQTRGQGEGAAYRVSAFARVRLVSYQLPGQNRITARFLGFVACDAANQPPVVHAGPDQTLTLPATTTLNGSVSDDGLPVGGALTAAWGLVSGPGPVAFGDATAPSTTATFSLSGTYVLQLSASDSILSATDTVIITVNRENRPPVADGQSLTNFEDNPLDILLTGGDPDGDALSFVIVDGPSHGTLSGLPPQIQYTPFADYNGADSFTFRVNDGLLDSPIAIIAVTNVPVNDAPVADAQSLTGEEDTPLAVTLSGADLEGSALSFTVISGPIHGTLSGTNGVLTGATNHLTYIPTANYNGPDSFTFVLNDGELHSVAATVSITVLSLNDVPWVDTGPDQLVSLPANAVTLAGTVTDDYFEGATLTMQWSVLSGPAPVVLANPFTNHTTAALCLGPGYL